MSSNNPNVWHNLNGMHQPSGYSAVGFDNLNNNKNNWQQQSHMQNSNSFSSIGPGSLFLDSNNKASSQNSNVIYVSGLGESATEADLYTLFSNIGQIQRVNVIKNDKTGLCKGYGFVVFESFEEAFMAVQNMNGFMFQNMPLQVSIKSSLKQNNINTANMTNVRSSNNSNNDQYIY
jgi:RNA recognition motif-containing protein